MLALTSWRRTLLASIGVMATLGLSTLDTASPAAATRTEATPQTLGSASGDLGAGTLLVASRNLKDPNFLETVVVVLARTPDGTAGLILNRQTKVALERILPGVTADKPAPGLVFLGGPVGFSEARGLLRSTEARKGAYRVSKDTYLLNARDDITEALADGADTDRLRVYVGYAGWGAGQLEAEIRAGAWHVFGADTDVIFDPAPDTLWARQIRRTETLLAMQLSRFLAEITRN